MLHIGIHNSANSNSGDTLLFPLVRKIFDEFLGPCHWELTQAWDLFSLAEAIRCNRDFDGIVIGGGGLLLKDQTGSDVFNSGWQWNSTIEALQAIKIPVFVFAIGYNRFRGQPEFEPVFSNHIRLLVDKSNFFGLRNNGSIKALKNYLLPQQSCSLKRQFCPTTVLWQLYPKYRRLAQEHDLKFNKTFVFNAAFDRAKLRFGSDPDVTLNNIATAIKDVESRGWRIVIATHKLMDRGIEPFLYQNSVNFETVDLTFASPAKIMKFYSQVDFVFGMRGHAQMIPFGLRRPIMSLVSHDKMQYFLDDIGHPEWGIEIRDRKLSTSLCDFLQRIESNRSEVHAEIANAQNKVWDETESNFTNLIKI